MRQIRDAADVLGWALQEGGTVFACGNGGSAEQANHFVAELVGAYASRERPALRAISLSSNLPLLTALANDYGYENVFIRQLEALAERGDVLLALSTSGRSPNIVRALTWAQGFGMSTVALTGPPPTPRTGEDAAFWAETVLAAPETETPQIQETHLRWLHAICALVEEQAA